MYPILELKPDREKSILNQHPWIFSGAVKKMPQADEGAIVEVQDSLKRYLGYGFFSKTSQITCRLFEFGRTPVVLDEAYWIEKIRRAYEIRQKYVINLETNAYRLIHAEGDFLPGVIIDVYNEVAVLQLLIRGTERILAAIVQGLHKLSIQYIYLKTKESSQIIEQIQTDKGWLTEPYSKELIIRENGVTFPIDVEKGQKTGFFLDQRDNRLLLKHYARNKSVLNTFCYTGGFSVYALEGEASQVVSVDISKDAIETCEKTVQINAGFTSTHQSVVEDCFDYLKHNPTQYDIVILDPPAFAKNKKAIANASRGYISLNELGLKRVKPGGLLFTFSCSGNIDKDLFRKIVFTSAAEVGRRVRVIHQLTQPADHPINIYHPEGEYLKGLVLYVE
ncbi:MAG: class I SAM-dependent rRNA methyltransferase [Microscillaceae bacterium]|jgi:23S rRNA (cytosine1962-C5)-methyltransferase|nr:class I SAM-dependent rRNA methyltransferase [Microscillaceae bacterium]